MILKQTDIHTKFLYSAILTISTLIVFHKVLYLGFSAIDDSLYVYNNPHVTTGLRWENIKWALTTLEAEFWHPLTWITLMADATLYGMNPGGYHFSNLLLHLSTTVMIFFAFEGMTKNRINSFLIALVFGVHPLHVEPVAWISERKELLCGVFWSFSLLAYSRYCQRPTAKRYFYLTALFAMGNMAKSIIVTLPFVFLLIDYWPLKRYQTPDSFIKLKSFNKYSALVVLIAEKTPLFLISAFFCGITLHAQQSGGGIVSMATYSLGDRIVNAIISYKSYLIKSFFPLDLSIFYPFRLDLSIFDMIPSVVVLLSISIAVAISYRKRPYLVVGWCWFLGTVFPVSGIAKFGDFAMADRFMYLPSVGLILLAVWFLSDLLSRRNKGNSVFIIGMVLFAAMLGFYSNHYLKYWENDRKLFQRAAQVTFPNFFAHYAMGHLCAGKSDFKGAENEFRRSLFLRPDKQKIRIDLGRSVGAQGRYSEAFSIFDEVIRNQVRTPEVYFYKGLSLKGMGDDPRAITEILNALESDNRNSIGIKDKKVLVGCVARAVKEHAYAKAYALLGIDKPGKPSHLFISGFKRWRIDAVSGSSGGEGKKRRKE